MLDIGDHEVHLLYSFKRRDETLICHLCLGGIIGALERKDSSIDERDDIIAIEGLSEGSVHFLGLFFLSAVRTFLSELVSVHPMVTGLDKPVDSPVFGVADVLVLPTASAVLDDSLVIEFACNWVNKSHQTMAVLSLQLHLEMSNVVARCARHVSGLNSHANQGLKQKSHS